MKKYTSYIIGNVILFYLIPFIISKIKLISGLTNMISLMFIMFLLAILSMSFGKRHGFSILLPLISFIAFLPSAFIQAYTIPRIVYCAIVYTVACIIGNLLGMMFRKKKAK